MTEHNLDIQSEEARARSCGLSSDCPLVWRPSCYNRYDDDDRKNINTLTERKRDESTTKTQFMLKEKHGPRRCRISALYAIRGQTEDGGLVSQNGLFTL